jgi:hypothetical protein
MLHLMTIAHVICFQSADFNLMYKLPEDDTDVPKHVGAVKHHAVKCVCSLCIKLVLEKNIKQSAQNENFQLFVVVVVLLAVHLSILLVINQLKFVH